MLGRLSNRDNVERTPPVPPRPDVEEGAAEAGKAEQGDGGLENISPAFPGKKQFNKRRMWSLYSGLRVRIFVFYRKRCRWDRFMASSVSIRVFLNSSCWNKGMCCASLELFFFFK